MGMGFNEHELALIAKMTPQHRALMEKLTKREKQSLAQNVKSPEDIEHIQSWIGSDAEIERLLFWDKGGKYDYPEWRVLKPVDETTAELFDFAKKRYEQLKLESVEYQRRSDLTLLSQFIPSLLFTGITGAVRCDSDGSPNLKGQFFKGIELRCVGSVGEQINAITIFPESPNEFEVHFGGRINDAAEGISVYTGDSHSLLQLAQFLSRTVAKTDFQAEVKNQNGETLTLDPKLIRHAAIEGKPLEYEKELQLYCGVRTQRKDRAMDRAMELQRGFYERFGLEVECAKIGKTYPNFHIMRDDNFGDFLPDIPVQTDGLVMLTATLVCRRCRRELRDFLEMARTFPNITFALVNLSSPQFKFYERVFGDMGGGDVENFRKTAAGVTPFVIIYAPDDKGVLRYVTYLSTAKTENPPSKEAAFAAIRQHLG
jgi:hypothetical protein